MTDNIIPIGRSAIQQLTAQLELRARQYRGAADALSEEFWRDGWDMVYVGPYAQVSHSLSSRADELDDLAKLLTEQIKPATAARLSAQLNVWDSPEDNAGELDTAVNAMEEFVSVREGWRSIEDADARLMRWIIAGEQFLAETDPEKEVRP